jgi:hypothetical protein
LLENALFRFAQVFASGLPLGLRFAHARKTAQLG